MPKKFALFLFSPLWLCAGFFDWLDPLSAKAQYAEKALEGFDIQIEQALHDFQVPGLAVGVVVDGHVVYAKGFGLRDVENKLPVTKDTLFAIGSCTKAFTTFAVGNLVDEGLIEWDQPVIDILPEFRLWDQYATTRLTLRDLLTHRTGIPRHDFVWYNSKMSRPELLKRIRYLQPSFELRERYYYGQLTYFTAGLAIERASNKSWEQLIQEKILNPLGMTHTNFSINEMKKNNNYAHPYLERNDQLKKVALRNLDLIGPAGAMNSNIDDMTHWLQMQLASGTYKGQTLISPATLQELRAPQVVVPGVPETKETLLYSYGIGWAILSYRGHYFVSHDGISDGFTSVVGLLPNEGVGVVVLANKNMSSLPRYLSLEVVDRVLGLSHHGWFKEGVDSLRKNKESMKENKMREDRQRKLNTHSCHPLEDYAGVYEHPGYGRLTVEHVNGKLEIHYNDMVFVLDHWHYDVFSVVQEKQDTIVSFEGSKFTFTNHSNGDIGGVSVPFEPTGEDIFFKRNPAEKHSTLTYMRQFTGIYEIYGYTVEILIKNNTLIAVIPGQSNYELIPTAENEFAIKSLTSSTVRFVMKDGKVEEALLVHPYGAFSVTPKR